MTYDKALVRFNATRHGVLSPYMVLPWEHGEEYGAVLAAFREEHAPPRPPAVSVGPIKATLCRKPLRKGGS